MNRRRLGSFYNGQGLFRRHAFIGNMNSRAEIFRVVFSPRRIAAIDQPLFRGYPAMDIMERAIYTAQHIVPQSSSAIQ